jgi:hypothetical protein
MIIRWLVIISFVFAAWEAMARDNGQFAQVDPGIRAWFNTLTNKLRGQCCSFADGFSIDSPDWERTTDPDNPFRVRINGRWWNVPESTVVSSNNRIGRAVVWPVMNGENVQYIRCFIAGPES